MAFVQMAYAQPDTVFIPAQHLDSRSGLVGEDECRAFVPRGFQFILDVLCQRVDPAPHINGFHDQEDIFRPEYVWTSVSRVEWQLIRKR